ncbi:unnamed protein product, partial [Closterium sp. Naga37s-1]
KGISSWPSILIITSSQPSSPSPPVSPELERLVLLRLSARRCCFFCCSEWRRRRASVLQRPQMLP